ncbi:MAG: metal ABC transporter ATP-binding protein, partial [Parcubacteria group bacterium]|nr:metal ABC transporter ATP-binding protein [Parcubacteria group bacterium]
GQVAYAGEVRWHEKPRFGYVPQRFEFDRHFPMTVEEIFLLKSGRNFWFGRGRERQRIKQALREVGIERLWKSNVGELSSGEMQRVLIAYALMDHPNTLLFDEPTANIDVGAEATIYTLIRRVAAERELTVLLISHDLSVVYQHADTVVCMNRNLVCFGAPQHVLTPEKLSELYRSHTTFHAHETQH